MIRHVLSDRYVLSDMCAALCDKIRLYVHDPFQRLVFKTHIKVLCVCG